MPLTRLPECSRGLHKWQLIGAVDASKGWHAADLSELLGWITEVEERGHSRAVHRFTAIGYEGNGSVSAQRRALGRPTALPPVAKAQFSALVTITLCT